MLSEGLNISPDDDILCISSSGDNVLNLLLDKPQSIVAVDMSPAQNSTLEIKIAGIKLLCVEAFHKLIGVAETTKEERMLLYRSVRKEMPEYAQVYWDKHTDIIAAGIAFSGRFDLYIQDFANKCISIVGQPRLDKFFKCSTLEEQKREFEQWPLDELKEALLGHVSSKEQAKKGRSKAQLKHVKMSEQELVESIWNRFERVCKNVPVSDNFYLSWWLRGKTQDLDTNFQPIYLRNKEFYALKDLIGRIKVVTSTIEDYLQDQSVSLSKVVLSDVFEYMSEESMLASMKLLVTRTRSKGRIAYWNFACPRECPEALRDKVQPLRELSERLYALDRVFFYTAFYIDEVL